MDKRRESLVSLREHVGMSQYDVAAALGMPRSTYGQVELGKRPLRIELAAKLSQLFGCTIDAVFYGIDGPVSKPNRQTNEEVLPGA